MVAKFNCESSVPSETSNAFAIICTASNCWLLSFSISKTIVPPLSLSAGELDVLFNLKYGPAVALASSESSCKRFVLLSVAVSN